jgi:cell division inhibitor SulA
MPPSTGSGRFPDHPRRQPATPAAPAWARSQEVHSSLISPSRILHPVLYSEFVAQVSLAFALPFLRQGETANRRWQCEIPGQGSLAKAIVKTFAAKGKVSQ